MIVRALIVAGAVAATTLGVTAPATAGQNVHAQLPVGNGHFTPTTVIYGAFHHQGDWLQLVYPCRRWDLGTVGYLQVRYGAKKNTYYVAKSGRPYPCGQSWINRDFQEGQYIGIQVCVVLRGRDKCSGWRWGIA